jgi:hypothetical protein
MSLIKGLKQRPSIVIATVLAFLVLGGIAIRHASRWPAKASSGDKQHLQNQLRRGVGSEVRFASGPEQAEEAVASAADFIRGRSGLKLSDELKKELAKAESDVLSGKSPYISVNELTDDMTIAVVDRLATLSDEDIKQATEASADTSGEIRSRADAKWGVMSKKDLIQQAKAGREWSQHGDSGLQIGLRSMIEGEVNNRVSALSAHLPEQFGNVNSQGLTPTQALLITYSVAMDDPLTNSRSDIAQLLIQKRMDDGVTREQQKARKNASDLPYGPNGFLHPSGLHVFFTRDSVKKLLNLNEGGKKR